MPTKLSIRDLDLHGKRVLIRVDFNVPLENGRITDDTRIRETIPTLELALRQGAKVILAAHLGRPKGKHVDGLSLRPVAVRLRELLDHVLSPDENVGFSPDCVGEIAREMAGNLESGQTLLLENLRFHAEEEENDHGFAKQLAGLCDVYVDDAFGAAHRAHASTEGIAQVIKARGGQAAAGLLMQKELEYLGKAVTHPNRPFVAIIGGAKVSDKIEVINALLDKVDALLIGGAMAYTFLNAKGQTTGKSLVEPDKMEIAKAALEKAATRGVKLLLPVDHVLADKFAADAHTEVFGGDGPFPADKMALDIGPETIKLLPPRLPVPPPWCGTAPWVWPSWRPSPMGRTPLRKRSRTTPPRPPLLAVATPWLPSRTRATPTASATSPRAGGASLEFLEGKALPGVEALSDRSS